MAASACAARSVTLPWLMDSAIGFDVRVRDESEAVAALSLQGPCAYAVLARAGFADAKSLKPFQLADFRFGKSGKVMISRTGFTADLGYELWTTPEKALELWDLLMEKGALHGLRPIGTTALNMARIEAGFMIANMDFVSATTALRPDRLRSPFDMGLDWMVDFNKGPFNGRAALNRERESASTQWAFVGLDIDGNVEAEHALIYDNKKHEVGHITAALWSPTTKRNIALAMLRRPYHAEKSGNLWVEIYALRELEYHKLMVKAAVVPRQFFNPCPPPRDTARPDVRRRQQMNHDCIVPSLPRRSWTSARHPFPPAGTRMARTTPANWPPYRREAGFTRAASTTWPPLTLRKVEIAGQRLFLVKDDKGGIRCFHNTCRHRGSELCASSTSSASNPNSSPVPITSGVMISRAGWCACRMCRRRRASTRRHTACSARR
jgi:glycine cleavage system aminomethyltransferase T